MTTTPTPGQKTPESAIRSVLSAPTQDPTTTGPPASVFLYLADTNLCPILSTTTTTDSTSSPQPFPVTVLSQLTASYVSIQELLSRCGNGPSARITTRLTNGDIIIQSLLLGSNAPKKPPLPNPATETFLRPPGILSALSSVSHTPRQASATASLMDISPGPGTDTDTDNDNTNEPSRRARRQQRVQSQQDSGLPPSLVYTVYACHPPAAAASPTPESSDPPTKSLYVLASEEATKLEWLGKRWQEEWGGEPGVA